MLDQVALARRLRRALLTLFLLFFLAAPIALWFAYPPSRILVPALAPVTCGTGNVCVDDPGRMAEAEALYAEALRFVSEKVGQIKSPPPMYFCSTQACSAHFGWDGVAAYNVGVFGATIKPGWWRSFIVRHELIHHLQNERLGMLNYVLNKPTWLLEGMAYSLSEDPRRSFSKAPGVDGYRAAFEAWYADVGADQLWREAAGVGR